MNKRNPSNRNRGRSSRNSGNVAMKRESKDLSQSVKNGGIFRMPPSLCGCGTDGLFPDHGSRLLNVSRKIHRGTRRTRYRQFGHDAFADRQHEREPVVSGRFHLHRNDFILLFGHLYFVGKIRSRELQRIAARIAARSFFADIG